MEMTEAVFTRVVQQKSRRSQAHRDRINETTRETATAHGEPWSVDELEVLRQGVAEGLTFAELAVILGRTLHGVAQKFKLAFPTLSAPRQKRRCTHDLTDRSPSGHCLACQRTQRARKGSATEVARV